MDQSSDSSVQTKIFPPENIKNTILYTKYTERNIVKMMLNCFVLDTGAHLQIPLEEKISVGKYEYPIESLPIGILKKYIWELEEEVLKELANNVSKLDFWHVNVKEVVNVFNEDDIVQKLGGKKMQPNYLFSDYISVRDPPPKRNIHIIIQPTITVSPIPFNELAKTEIKNKVIKAFPRVKTSSIEWLIDALILIWNIEAVKSDSPDQQNDPYVELKKEPSFFKVNFPRGITVGTSKTVDLCLPSYSKSGMNYHNPFYDDPQFKETVSLVQKKIGDNSNDIIVLSGVSGGGKTSTAFGIAMERWSIYIDFSPNTGDYRGSQLQSELQIIRGIYPPFERVDQQNEVFHILDMAVVSRGLILIKMLTEGKISTPKDWLFVQLQLADTEIRTVISTEMSGHDSRTMTLLIEKINDFLGINSLVLIFDEAQILCRPEYGKYQGSTHGKKWNLLQGYIAHLTKHPVTCLLAGTYMHMASGLSLVTSVGKAPKRKAHIVLKLPFLSSDDVLRNLRSAIDLTYVAPYICDHLGYILQGRPRNCASFVRLLTSKKRSISETKDQVLNALVPLWRKNICSTMVEYLETTCEYIGADLINPGNAIMDILRLRVFYNQNYKEAIRLLQHSIIPCKSPACIVFSSEAEEDSDTIEINGSYPSFEPIIIEINPSLESYLVDSIVLFLKNTHRELLDVFVDNIIHLNNTSSIGNEFDAVFITAIINKNGYNVREELNKWKNGQQFNLPSWITPTMQFVTTSNLSKNIPIVKYVDNKIYSSYAIQPDSFSGSDVVIYLKDDDDNVVLLSASCTVSSDPVKKSKVKEQLIKSCMRFQYMEQPKNNNNNKNDDEFSHKEQNRLETGFSDDVLPDDSTSNLERKEKAKKKKNKKEKKKVDVNYDLKYDENIKNYRISKVSKHAEYHEKIKTSTENRKHIYVSVELPYRKGDRSELFRLNDFDDLVIIVDDRNMEHVFGPGITRLVERISYKVNPKEQEELMNAQFKFKK